VTKHRKFEWMLAIAAELYRSYINEIPRDIRHYCMKTLGCACRAVVTKCFFTLNILLYFSLSYYSAIRATLRLQLSSCTGAHISGGLRRLRHRHEVFRDKRSQVQRGSRTHRRWRYLKLAMSVESRAQGAQFF
jgi:hypothetical protein